MPSTPKLRVPGTHSMSEINAFTWFKSVIIASDQSDTEVINVSQQLTWDPSIRINTIGKVVTCGDYMLKSLFWIPPGILMQLFIIFHGKNHLCETLSYIQFVSGITALFIVLYPVYAAEKLRSFHIWIKLIIICYWSNKYFGYFGYIACIYAFIGSYSRWTLTQLIKIKIVRSKTIGVKI